MWRDYPYVARVTFFSSSEEQHVVDEANELFSGWQKVAPTKIALESNNDMDI